MAREETNRIQSRGLVVLELGKKYIYYDMNI